MVFFGKPSKTLQIQRKDIHKGPRLVGDVSLTTRREEMEGEGEKEALVAFFILTEKGSEW